MMMNITDMNKMDKAVIKSIRNLDKSFQERLMDLGVYESANIILLNKLAFNKLFLIEVDEIEICLRKEDAMMIEVVL
jgi:Fe2+ transport system protein FeoA